MSEDTGSGSGSHAPTVSAATPLYPFALAYNLDPGQLAQVSELASCFLCTQVGMEPVQAAIFAKQLYGEAVSTVGTFLQMTHETIITKQLSLTCVASLDKYLQRFAGLPENRHAALAEAAAEGKAESEGSVGKCHTVLHCVAVVCTLSPTSNDHLVTDSKSNVSNKTH